MKKIDTQEKLVLFIILLILSMTGVTLFSLWAMNRPPVSPGTGVPGETVELRESAVRFARENEALLRQAVQELETLPEGTYEVFYARDSKEYIANNGSWHTMENRLLADLLENTGIDRIDRTGNSWLFHLECGEASVLETKSYSILYSGGDPADDLYPSGEWTETGGGRYTRRETEFGEKTLRYTESDDVYLEEIGGGFWYFYEYDI